jgi:hypothetical protein
VSGAGHRRHAFFTDRWRRTVGKLSAERLAGCERAVLRLLDELNRPGLRVKPILPDKYYFEARIDRGDRIIFRIDGETIFFIDVVTHDDIGRYSRRPRGAR